MELFPAQFNTALELQRILRDYPGAVLRGEEGTGKTLIGGTVAELYNKTLWVAPARAIKDLQAKMDSYDLDANIDFVSYHKFGDVSKLSASKIKEYDFIVVDECAAMRNYSASWTKRLVKLKSDKQYLFMSGTPLLKSPKDFIYVLRKCGLWKGKNTEYIYKRYFGAEKSRFGDFLEFKEFQNATCFQSQVDRVTAVLSHKDIDKSMPEMEVSIELIDCKYIKPKDITEETETRKQNGLNKVPQVAEIIKKTRKEKGVHISLVLCHFHETAKALHEKLGGELALDAKQVRKAIDKIKDEGGHLVTTLGLTDCSLDFNECNHVFLAESTYSFPLDRQSINRCRRIGKSDIVEVMYIAHKEEAPVIRSFQRKYLTGKVGGHAKMSPSKLARLEKCPGSYWLPDTLTKEDYIEVAARLGSKNHAILERYTNDLSADLSHAPSEFIEAIRYCRKLKESSDRSGSEVYAKAEHIHEEIKGTADFYAYDEDKQLLTILDYKNGSSPVDVKNNIQLQAYALMVSHTYKLPVKKLVTIIFQKNKMKHCIYDENVIEYIENRLRKVVAAIKAAKKDPISHLGKNPCDFFCTARVYHKAQKETEEDNWD